MRSVVYQTALTVVLSGVITAVKAPQERLANEKIDFRGFVQMSEEVAEYRESRRVTEAEFLRLSKQEGVVVLDTRSAEKYQLLHVAGAKHLNFSDITEASLAKVIGDRETPVLIYCNNNFRDEPAAFPEKRIVAALNIPTFITLYGYGYRNVYELGPVIDPADSLLRFEGTLAQKE